LLKPVTFFRRSLAEGSQAQNFLTDPRTNKCTRHFVHAIHYTTTFPKYPLLTTNPYSYHPIAVTSCVCKVI